MKIAKLQSGKRWNHPRGVLFLQGIIRIFRGHYGKVERKLLSITFAREDF